MCDYGFKENIAKKWLNADAAEESNKDFWEILQTCHTFFYTMMCDLL